jgi:NADPH:quinone reductase-like Zn-dependent oxidoreductase
MKSFGRMVAIVPVTGDLDACRRRNITLHFLMVSPAGRKLDRLRALLDSGRIRPVIDSRMSLRDVARAHERLEKGGVRGKIILDVAGAS